MDRNHLKRTVSDVSSGKRRHLDRSEIEQALALAKVLPPPKTAGDWARGQPTNETLLRSLLHVSLMHKLALAELLGILSYIH
eukprot:COSAG05_NODE_1805_length_4045_cov_24.194015_4_plen_82_part_00